MISRTTTQLLEDLRNPANGEAWRGFVDRYQPVIEGFARALGCGGEDARDVAQQTLAQFASAYRQGRYERGRGRLSSWLLGIARNCARAQQRGEGRAQPAGSGVEEVAAASEAQLTQIWTREREVAVLAQALEALRRSPRIEEHTLRAFELVAIRGVPPAEVAAQCGIEIETVYVIKNRLTTRLRELVREITAAYDEDE